MSTKLYRYRCCLLTFVIADRDSYHDEKGHLNDSEENKMAGEMEVKLSKQIPVSTRII